MYHYDVFISYLRTADPIARWVRNHFHPRLRELLDGNLDREVRVFFDGSVRVGGKWPDELRSALRHTRVLVPVCSPKYFYNEWCRAEWASMERREELAGGDCPTTLIYPVIYCDSKNFPSFAHERRMQDLTEWNHPYEQFEVSPKYIAFHDQMNRIAKEIEELVSAAPAWCPDWPVLTPRPDVPPVSRLPRL
ncbi:TIR domain-containing protein [Amycolatopsis circi]|uniref:TIR domain-containing protein n=1 Tax=Amycolatopsis circi TaxID=871959 RepID=UPI001ABF5E0E|nr:TIR domain-containing protein [Amycolatopsis circi]